MKQIEHIFKWANMLDMRVQQLELDIVYIPSLDLTISHDGHLYTIED